MQTNFEEKDLFKRGRNKGWGFAIFLIVFGALYLLLNLNIIPIEYKPLFISWQMLLIALGIWFTIKRHYIGALFLIATGIFFIYPTLCSIFPDYFVSFDVDFKTYWPVILIIIGVNLILSRFFPCSNKCNTHKGKESGACNLNNGDYIDKNIMFGGVEQIVLSQNFKGGEANVMFGELIIDLRKAKLSEECDILDANVMFGSIVIQMPSDWNLEIKSDTLFGAFEDKRNLTNNISLDNRPRLRIQGSVMFGSVEIRN